LQAIPQLIDSVIDPIEDNPHHQVAPPGLDVLVHVQHMLFGCVSGVAPCAKISV
jgi:hypothetical protein